MKMIGLLVLLLLSGTLSISACAQGSIDERIAKFLEAKPRLKPSETHTYLQGLFPEWEMKRMRNVCMMIGSRTLPEEDGTRFRYMYQQRFYEAAKVDTLRDNEETIAKKISAMWKIYQAAGLSACNSSTFDVRDGNLLKYAVADKFDDFLYDAVKWKLDMNHVDFYDQMSLLDYVEYHVKRTKGTALEPVYQKYYTLFRKAGARHKREL